MERLAQWNGKAFLYQEQTVTIRSDASLQEWGAVCNGTRTGGPWSQLEQGMHINFLELLAATLAVKIFLEGSFRNICTPTTGQPDSCGLHKQHGGTVSPQLTDLAKDLWMWALSNNIILSAEHIPGVLNNVADIESRTITDRTD